MEAREYNVHFQIKVNLVVPEEQDLWQTVDQVEKRIVRQLDMERGLKIIFAHLEFICKTEV